MAGYAHITRCNELTEGDILAALEERAASKALLERLAKVARPREGAQKLLVVLARIAGREVDWADGPLRVEVNADGNAVTIEVLTELGLDEMKERIFPVLRVSAPFREFARLVELMPGTLEPLVAVTRTPKKLVLAAIGRMSAAPGGRRESKPDFDPEMPTRVPPRTGKTLRPPEVAAPAPTRKRTLRPDVHAVPPPVPSVPQAPRLPRMSREQVEPSAPGRAKPRGIKLATKAANAGEGRAASSRGEPPDEEGPGSDPDASD